MATNTGSPAERLEALAASLDALFRDVHVVGRHPEQERQWAERMGELHSIVQQVAQQAQPEEMRTKALALSAVEAGVFAVRYEATGRWRAMSVSDLLHETTLTLAEPVEMFATALDALYAAAEALGLTPDPSLMPVQVPAGCVLVKLPESDLRGEVEHIWRNALSLSVQEAEEAGRNASPEYKPEWSKWVRAYSWVRDTVSAALNATEEAEQCP